MIQNYWKNIGINASVVIVDPQLIDEKVIRTRDYEALLYGNIVLPIPDLYSFWNSSQKFYPGYNLALYDNPNVDKLIDSARQIDIESDQRKLIINQIQEYIVNDFPAVFLVSPNYFYVHKRNLWGINPKNIYFSESRFWNINEWFVKTKRVFK
jgi:peptide/nickel transport system substrate-binding protein